MKIFNKVAVFGLALFLALVVSNVALAATAVQLGTADSFAVLGASTVTNTGSTVVNGGLGLSPGTSVTGFPPGMVNGTQHITNATAAQAQADLVTAYNAASGQTVGVTMVSGDLGGQTLLPGLYKSASAVGLTGTLTLNGQGNQDSVFIFQVGSALTTASASRVNLINGAQACNVFWQIGSSATLGTNSTFVGTILALASVTVNTGASVSGRVLARTGAVTLDTSPISRPTCAAPAVVSVPVTPTSTPIIFVSATSTPIVVPPIIAPTTIVPMVLVSPVPTVVPLAVAPAVVPLVVVAPTTVSLATLPNTGIGFANELPLYAVLFVIVSAPLAMYLIGRREYQ